MKSIFSNLFELNRWLALSLFFVAPIAICDTKPTQAQESQQQLQTPPSVPVHRDAQPRDSFFAIESLETKTQDLSQELLGKALESEAFYTLVGQLKPVSEGFWDSYISLETPNLSEIERVREALAAWNESKIYYANVLVYESTQRGQRYASAYVVHVPSLRRVVESNGNFFGRLGITEKTPPAEVMLTIERCRQPDDRWRGFGMVFGYPHYAIDFFVNAGMHQRETGEFIERDFRQIPTFASQSGSFVYAVPKLSPLQLEDRSLQRRAVVLLDKYRELREQGPKLKPVELLRNWMDAGNGACHPEHILAKLPPKTDAELDAAIAKWNAPKTRPPQTFFNHLFVVFNQTDFDALRKSSFVRDELAASDQGLPKFHAVDENCQAIYLRGLDTYLELLGPNNKFNEPVGKIGIGWSVEKVGELDTVQHLLTKNSTAEFTKELTRWDFDREGAVDWYYALYHASSPAANACWWFSEYHRDFIPALFPEKKLQGSRLARRDLLDSQYDPKRIIKNVHSLTIELPKDAANALRSDLGTLGWNVEQFDSRTWILRGPEFRILLTVRQDIESAKLKSIGFTTNPGREPQGPARIADGIEIVIDGADAGWIDIK
jgi:hypothetical protein